MIHVKCHCFVFVDVHCHFFEFVVTHCILFYLFPIEINTTYILLYTEHINIYYFLIRISKKNRKHNCQKKKYKRTNNDLQNIHIKLKIE